MPDLKVLIVGASIAGPTAAYWFSKAGARVTVIERFPSLRMGGQGIDIRGPGVTVMKKIPGMEAAVRAKSTTMDGIAFVDKNSKPIATMMSTGNVDQQSLVSEFEIFRDSLSKIIYDLTKDDSRINYVFGEQVAAIKQEDDGPVSVEFANGSPAAEYDLVVACDGATSRTRAIGYNCSARDHIETVNTWTAYFTIGKDMLNGSTIAQGWSAVGGRFIGVGPDPAGGNRVGLSKIYPRRQQGATEPFREAQKQGTEALKTYVANTFVDVGWRGEEILEEMMQSDDFYASELVQVKVPSLYNGRFVPVGDAGYAGGPTGFGTSLAMTGGYVLAGEICKHKGDLAAGLRGYEGTMKPMIAEMTKIPPGVPGVMAPQTAWGIWFRNLVFIAVAWASSFGSTFGWIGQYFSKAFGGLEYELPECKWQA